MSEVDKLRAAIAIAVVFFVGVYALWCLGAFIIEKVKKKMADKERRLSDEHYLTGEQRMTFRVVALFVVGCAFTFCFCWHQNAEVKRHAIQQGYSQQTLPGKSGAYWVKNGCELAGE